MTDDFHKLSESLDVVMRTLRGPTRKDMGGVFGRWDEIVGAHIAAHVQPLSLDKGVLTVRVDDPAWATQIKFLVPQIQRHLAQHADVKIERIEVRVQRS